MKNTPVSCLNMIRAMDVRAHYWNTILQGKRFSSVYMEKTNGWRSGCGLRDVVIPLRKKGSESCPFCNVDTWYMSHEINRCVNIVILKFNNLYSNNEKSGIFVLKYILKSLPVYGGMKLCLRFLFVRITQLKRRSTRK